MTDDGYDESVTGRGNADGTCFSDLFDRFWDSTVADGATDRQVAAIERHLQLRPGARVIVAPSHCGRLVLALAGRGYKVMGIDRCGDAISRSRSLAERACSCAQFHCSEDLSPVPTEDFDGAVYVGHGLSPEAVARQLAVVLGPGARAIVETDGEEAQLSLVLVAAGFELIERCPGMNEDPYGAPVRPLLICRRG